MKELIKALKLIPDLMKRQTTRLITAALKHKKIVTSLMSFCIQLRWQAALLACGLNS